jgi:hypothetical protein
MQYEIMSGTRQKHKFKIKNPNIREKFTFFKIILGNLDTPGTRHLVFSILFITFMDDFE